MYKKIFALLFLCFLVMGAASAADFKINDGFTAINEYFAINDENGMYLYTWDYDDKAIQEAYLQNSTENSIAPGENGTYYVTFNTSSSIGDVLSYVSSGNVTLDHGILEIAEVDGNKYIFMTYLEEGTAEDWKACYDELMIFNENNNIEPIADAI